MAAERSGAVEVDRCRTCGALWFDAGEIRELTEGRLDTGPEEGGIASSPPATPGDKRIALREAWEKVRGLSCPRCGEPLRPADFQLTGVPVFRCARCEGMLVSRSGVKALGSRFRFQRDHAALYASLGASLAEEVRRRENRRLGPDVPQVRGGDLPMPGLPVLVPLSDAGTPAGRDPVVVYGIVAITVLAHLLGWIGTGPAGITPERFALPAGTGFSGVPKSALFLAPFVHGGIVPLVVGCAFLLVLGDNVEDRLGRLPFLLFFLFCGAVAGGAHVLWGRAGMPGALGSAGAVAGVLGAYLVFFPEVPIRMYGMGRTVTVPAYLFACAWAVTVFLWGWGPGPLASLLNPAPYSLAAHLAGFAAGVAGAALFRGAE